MQKPDRIDRIDKPATWIALVVVIAVAVAAQRWPLLVFAPVVAGIVWEVEIKVRSVRRFQRNCRAQITRVKLCLDRMTPLNDRRWLASR